VSAAMQRRFALVTLAYGMAILRQVTAPSVRDFEKMGSVLFRPYDTRAAVTDDS